MSQYATLDEENNNGSLPEHVEEDDDVQSVSILSRASVSVTSRNKRVVDDESLKEPLTADSDDPFYVFREDLYRKLDLVEENLTEYLRIVHQTVRTKGVFSFLSLESFFSHAIYYTTGHCSQCTCRQGFQKTVETSLEKC